MAADHDTVVLAWLPEDQPFLVLVEQLKCPTPRYSGIDDDDTRRLRVGLRRSGAVFTLPSRISLRGRSLSRLERNWSASGANLRLSHASGGGDSERSRVTINEGSFRLAAMPAISSESSMSLALRDRYNLRGFPNQGPVRLLRGRGSGRGWLCGPGWRACGPAVSRSGWSQPHCTRLGSARIGLCPFRAIRLAQNLPTREFRHSHVQRIWPRAAPTVTLRTLGGIWRDGWKKRGPRADAMGRSLLGGPESVGRATTAGRLLGALFAKDSPPERVRSAERTGHIPQLWLRLLENGALEMAVDEQARRLGSLVARPGPGGRTAWAVSRLGAALGGQGGRPPPGSAVVVPCEELPAPAASGQRAARVGPGRRPVVTLALHPPTPDAVLTLVPAGAIADDVLFFDGDTSRHVALDSSETAAGQTVAGTGVTGTATAWLRRRHATNIGSLPLADVDVPASARTDPLSATDLGLRAGVEEGRAALGGLVFYF